jgi:hypothetical protein
MMNEPSKYEFLEKAEIQRQLALFVAFYVSSQSQYISEAIELNSFNQINVEKLLAVKGLAESYVFRLKDAWRAWLRCAETMKYENLEKSRKDQIKEN